MNSPTQSLTVQVVDKELNCARNIHAAVKEAKAGSCSI